MKLIPDSSFFICFTGDLDGLLPLECRLDYLHRFADNFDIIVVPMVGTEVEFTGGSETLKPKIRFIGLNDFIQDGTNILEPLRPIWSKGEYEVILVAYSLKLKNDLDFLYVLDDGLARVIVETLIVELKDNLIGTIGLIGYCNNQKLFSKQEAIGLLKLIKDSRFRIKPLIIDMLIRQIEAGEPGG